MNGFFRQSSKGLYFLPHRWIAVWGTKAKQVFGSLQIKENIGGNEEVKVIKNIEQNVEEPATKDPSVGQAQPQNGLFIIPPV